MTIDPAYIITAADRADAERQAAVPSKISFIQLIAGLVTAGWISEAEGKAWFLTGTLPQAAENVIQSLPADQRFAARIRAARPSLVERTDTLVSALAAAEGKTEAEMDAFFIAAGEV